MVVYVLKKTFYNTQTAKSSTYYNMCEFALS